MKKLNFSVLKKIRRHYLITALALILLVEIIWAASIFSFAKRPASPMLTVDSMANATRTVGVSLYESSRTAQVNNALLSTLSQVHAEESNTVRLPVDFIGHTNGGTVDGGWLGQVATLMEMAFQSNCRVVLAQTPFDSSATSAVDYVNIWQQIDASFGHRPANELWYELYIPADTDPVAFGQELLPLITSMRARNENRQIVLLLDDAMDDVQRSAIVGAFARYNVNIGLFAEHGMDAEFLYLFGLQNQLSETGNSIIIICKDGTKDDADLTALVKNVADQGGMGYLLQGD